MYNQTVHKSGMTPLKREVADVLVIIVFKYLVTFAKGFKAAT